jgi:hypothetical protein
MSVSKKKWGITFLLLPNVRMVLVVIDGLVMIIISWIIYQYI